MRRMLFSLLTSGHITFHGVPGMAMGGREPDMLERGFGMADSVALPYQSESFELGSAEPVLREYFPETWLWSLETVGKSGQF